MNTRELAQTIDAPEYFVWRQLRAADKAKFLRIERIPGKGRTWFTNPADFARWLRHRGYHAAAIRLESI